MKIVTTHSLAHAKEWVLVFCGLMLGCQPASTPKPQEAIAIRRILLISIDTCRADHLGCYGFHRRSTPQLDALAQESVLFERVVSPVPLTLPAHASMLTGTNPTYHGIHDNYAFRLADDQTTLAELVTQQGFSAGAIVSAFVIDSQFGLDQGFDQYEDAFSEEHLVHGTFAERKGDQTTKLAVEWLEQHENEDFFLFLHYFDPHEDYAPPEPFASRFADDPYSGEIAFTDYCVGRVLQKLKDLGLYETTLIMVVGDHGELLGEHGEPTHSYYIYRGAIEVPWIVKLPGRTTTDRIQDVAALIDVVPTVCGLLGIDPPPQVQGIDWTPRLLDPAAAIDVERAIYCECYTPTKYGAVPFLGVVDTRGWKYIHAPRPELFHIGQDPAEANNLIDDQPQLTSALQADLEHLLLSESADGEESQMEMDENALRTLASLGYVGGSVTGDASFDSAGLDPKDTFPLHILHQEVTIQLAHQRYREARLAAQKMVTNWPESPLGHKHLAKIEVDQGQFLEAQPHFEELIRLRPDDVEGHTNLGIIYRSQGKPEEAEAAYRRAIAIDPDHAPARNNLAFLLLAEHHHERAIDQLRKATEINPDYADAHFNLGRAFHETGQLDQAAKRFRRVLELKSDWLPALNALAWLLATNPDADPQDAQDAVRYAKRAAELTENKHAAILDTLAAAHAATGQFDLAVAAAEKALKTAEQADASEMADDIRAHLELFKQGQPYRESGRGN